VSWSSVASYAQLAQVAGDFASDLEAFRGAQRAGLDIEQCSRVTAENASLTHQNEWMLFADRLARGLDLFTAVYDLRASAQSYYFDDFGRVLLLTKALNLTGLARLLDLRARFYRKLAEDCHRAHSRIKSAKSVGWLAALSPWLLLVVLLARPENRQAFADVQGAVLLVVGLCATAFALFVSEHLSRARNISRPESPHSADLALGVAARIEVMAFMISGGFSVRECIEDSRPHEVGMSSAELDELDHLLDSENSLQDALVRSRLGASDPRLRELFTKLALADSLGTADFEEFYALAFAVRNQWLASRATTATAIETKLLFPQVLISLPLSVLFALYPSLGLLGARLI
jgi:hypothetical protein